MTLQELIAKNDIKWEDVKHQLILENGEIDARMGFPNYYEVFKYLKEGKVKEGFESPDFEIELTRCKDEYDEEDDEETMEYVDVSGYKNGKYYAIEFCTWDKWMNASLTERTLNGFTPLEIVCYCMMEMTFISFDEEEIQKTLKDMENSIAEIKLSHVSD